MTPDGQWIPRDSDYAKGLRGEGRLDHKGHYDQDGHYVGAEGRTASGDKNEYGQELDQQGDVLDKGTPWQDTFMAPLGNALGWNFAGYDQGYGQDTGSTYEDMEDTDEGFMNDANSGWGGYSRPSGPTQDTQAGVMPGATINHAGPPGASWGDWSAPNAQAAGPPGASWGDFSAPNAQAAGPPGASFNDFNTSPRGPFNSPDAPFGSASGLAAANAAAQAAAAQEAQAMAALEDWGGGMGFLGGPEIDVAGPEGGYGGEVGGRETGGGYHGR